MLRFAPRQASRIIAFTSAHQQAVPVAAATQALTARWMSAPAPGPKVCDVMRYDVCVYAQLDLCTYVLLSVTSLTNCNLYTRAQ